MSKHSWRQRLLQDEKWSCERSTDFRRGRVYATLPSPRSTAVPQTSKILFLSSTGFDAPAWQDACRITEFIALTSVGQSLSTVFLLFIRTLSEPYHQYRNLLSDYYTFQIEYKALKRFDLATTELGRAGVGKDDFDHCATPVAHATFIIPGPRRTYVVSNEVGDRRFGGPDRESSFYMHFIYVGLESGRSDLSQRSFDGRLQRDWRQNTCD